MIYPVIATLATEQPVCLPLFTLAFTFLYFASLFHRPLTTTTFFLLFFIQSQALFTCRIYQKTRSQTKIFWLIEDSISKVCLIQAWIIQQGLFIIYLLKHLLTLRFFQLFEPNFQKLSNKPDETPFHQLLSPGPFLLLRLIHCLYSLWIY